VAGGRSRSVVLGRRSPKRIRAAAYSYAAGGSPPYEVILSGYLDRFGGALNVLGRPLGVGEIRRMVTCENIINAYREQNSSSNMVEWTASNPEKADMLNKAHKLAVELGMIKDG
jgi:hypothetical protein